LVSGKLDSVNHSPILAENDHYRGAFAVFARFSFILWEKARKTGLATI
jgi:hypothetical protein